MGRRIGKKQTPHSESQVEMEGREGVIQRVEMCYMHVSTPHDGCNHYVLQTNTCKNILKHTQKRRKNRKRKKKSFSKASKYHIWID